MLKSLDEVIERLQYKADNIKAKLEPSYFTECIDYLKTLPRVEEEQEIRNNVIDEFVEKLSTNVESFEAEVNGIKADLMTEDYFHEYVWEIAEQMRKG